MESKMNVTKKMHIYIQIMEPTEKLFLQKKNTIYLVCL